jgi:catechol 2,3-dioxygenase-like lactoylglutathione lyase family enzyme
MIHHVSIRTADIHRAIAFYECLGFIIAERFTTGGTIACWLKGWGFRLELIQIPHPQPQVDTFADEGYVGYYHFTFDITDLSIDLSTWMKELAGKFALDDRLGNLKVLLSPHQQQIGSDLYEVAFIADPDNLPLEILRRY